MVGARRGRRGIRTLKPSVALESPLDPDGAALVRQAHEFSATLYPPASNHTLDAAALAHPSIRFFVARLDGIAVGCGAFYLDPNGSIEIKSVFVTTPTRGQGVGILLLDAIEQSARSAGAVVARLETGIASTAALGLYRRAGYRDCPPFGGYQPDPLSVFLEKPLEAVAPQRHS